MDRPAVVIVIAGFVASLMVCAIPGPHAIQAGETEDQRIRKLQEEIEARPDNPTLRNNLGIAYGQKAIALYEEGQLESAITHGKQAIKQYEIALDHSPSNETFLRNLAIAHLNLSVYYKSNKEFYSAESCLIRAAELFKKAGDDDEMVQAEIKLARLYRYSMEDLTRAEKKFKALVSTKKALIDQKTLAGLYADLAGTYGKRALALYNKHDLDSAIAAGKLAVLNYEASIALSPSDPTILKNLGITCINLGVYHKSNNEFGAAESCLIRAAELFEKAGDDDEMVQAEIKLARLYRYSMEDLTLAEKKFKALVSTKKALIDQKTLAGLYADLAGIYGKRALKFYKKHDPDSAIGAGKLAVQHYEKSIALSPSDPATLRNFGITCSNLGVYHKSNNEFGAAESCLIRAAELFHKAGSEAKVVQAQIELARLYRYSMEDLTRAEKKFKALLSTQKALIDQKTLAGLYADLAGIYGNRVLEFYKKNDPDSAIAAGKLAVQYYEESVALFPSDPAILRNFGITCLNLGTCHKADNQLESAERCLIQAAELFEKAGDTGEVINTRIQLGRLYRYSMEAPLRAEKVFQELIARNKDQMDNNTLSEVYLELAGIYITAEDLSKAQSVLIKSIQISGENPRSHLVLGQVYYWSGKKIEAFKEFQIAETVASSAGLKNVIGEAYRQLGLYEDAKRLFNKALEDPSADVRIAAHVGLGHCSTGQEEIRHYQKAIALEAESGDPSMLFIRGKLLLAKFTHLGNTQDLHEAIQLFQQAISTKTDESAYHNDLALAYMAMYKNTCEESDLESAMHQYRLAEKWYRGFPSSILLSNAAQDYLIYAAAKQSGCEDARHGYYQHSLRAIAEGKSVSPDVVARVDEAISHFERALTLSPERKEVYEKLRSIYYGLNRYESVRRLESTASQFGVRLTPLKLPR